jgi:hypothetical protein
MVSARKIACHEPDPNVTNAVTGRVALPVSGKTVSAQVGLIVIGTMPDSPRRHRR